MALSGQASMQALQRVHRSRSIGLPLSHSASKAPSQPRSDAQSARVHRTFVGLRQRAAVHEQRDVELVGQHRRGLFGGGRVADHQATAARAVADGGHRLRRRGLRCGDQRGDLRRGLARVARPAAGFADVDEVDRPFFDAGRAFGLFVQFEEQALLLRAGHQQRVAAGCAVLGGALKRRRFAPAQRAVQRVQAVRAGLRGLRQCLAQRLQVQRHRAVAVADQGLHRGLGFRWGPARPRRRGRP